jgi:hypothetical protein
MSVRRLVGSMTLVAGALCAAGLVYAQQAPPQELDLLGPDGPVVTAPDPALEDPLGEAVDEAPPGEVEAADEPDPVLAREENRASLEVAEEAAEEVPLEELEPPPPPPPPLRRPRHAAAVLMAVDKISAETLRFEAKVGEPIRYKSLVLTLRACESTAEDETIQDEIAHLEIIAQPEPVAGRATPAAREVYKGWAFASSPALHPIEHPLYDMWLVGCRRAVPVTAKKRPRPL